MSDPIDDREVALLPVEETDADPRIDSVAAGGALEVPGVMLGAGGRQAGPALCIWVPEGERAPSMVQAAAELRDRIDGRRLPGLIAFLLDGPPLDPAGAALVRARGPAVVLALVEGPGEQAPRLELDVDDEASRTLARSLPVPLLVKAPADRPRLPAPFLAWIDGADHATATVDGAVRARAASLLQAIAAHLGFLPSSPRGGEAPFRVVIRTRLSVGGSGLAGTAEAIVSAGDVVRAGQALALVGAPGLGRAALLSPESGIVLSIDRAANGPSIVLGKLSRALDLAERRLAGRAQPTGPLVVGWSEWVALPDLGVERIKAKIDTGARTSALHVVAIRPVGKPASAPVGRVVTDEGSAWVDVEIPAGRRATVTARCRIVEHASVRDSGGHQQRRPVIETDLIIGHLRRRIRLTLTDRGDMLFPMLIGRTALEDILVDPTARTRLGRP